MAKKGKVQADRDKKIKDEIARKKDFFRQLEKYVNMIGGEGTYSLIPKDHLPILYFMRCPTIRMTKSEDIPFTDKVLKSMNKSFGELLREFTVCLLVNNYEISIKDFCNIWLTLHTYLNLPDIKEDDSLIELKTRLADCQSSESRDRYISFVNHFLLTFAQSIGKGIHELVWTESKFEQNELHSSTAWLFKLKRIKIASRQIKYNNVKRTVYPCYNFINYEPQILKYSLSKIGIKAPSNSEKAVVYILEHTLNRLCERLSSIDVCYLKTYMLISLAFPKFYYESGNHFFIEMVIHEIKVGYFVAEYVDGIIIIRTFLFLTNNGTPEGRRLNSLTGLSKIDKKYLQIDHIAAFFESDIEENEHLRQLFSNAGCGELFKVRKIFITNKPITPMASFIDQYLTTGESDNNIDIEDNESYTSELLEIT